MSQEEIPISLALWKAGLQPKNQGDIFKIYSALHTFHWNRLICILRSA